MHCYVCSFLTIVFWLSTWSMACGQSALLDDMPKLLVPRQPPTRQEMQQRDSLKKYAEGLLYQHEDRHEDALKSFEEAARLDPDAPAVIKAQIPILITMDRLEEALKACKQVAALDPGDYYTWYVASKLLKSQVQYAEAIAALERGLQSESLKEHPEAAQQMYFELGSLNETAGKFGPAADAFNKAAAILEHPDLIVEKGPFPREAIQARAAETYEKIGQLYRKAKQYDQAIAALRKAQSHAPERSGRVSFHLAQLCLEEGKLEQALTDVEAYLRTQPLGLEAYEMKIDLLQKLKQTDRLLPWLEEASQRDRFNSGLQLLLAREYTRSRQSTKAEQLYKKVAEESPSADLYRGWFQLYQQEGIPGMRRILVMLNRVLEKVNRADAPTPVGNITHAKAMVEALRENGELAKGLVQVAYLQQNKQDELSFDTLYFLAILADRHQRNDEAERFYRSCLRELKISPDKEALVYSGLLRILVKSRKHEAVVEVCQHGLKSASATSPWFFYSEMARAQAALRRYEEALQNTDRCITQAGDDKKLIFKMLRVRILSMASRFDEAENECKALLKTHDQPTEVVEVRYLLSNIYSAAKQLAKAEEQLQMILKIDPANATVNNDLGYLWADQSKNLDTAENLIRKALEDDRSQRRKNPKFSIEEDKDNAAFVDSLGWVLFRRSQVEEARKELERATKLGDGDDPVIYDHLGDVYQHLSMSQEASRAWQRALDLYQQGSRRPDAERMRDIQRKIDQAKEEVGGR